MPVRPHLHILNTHILKSIVYLSMSKRPDGLRLLFPPHGLQCATLQSSTLEMVAISTLILKVAEPTSHFRRTRARDQDVRTPTMCCRCVLDADFCITAAPAY